MADPLAGPSLRRLRICLFCGQTLWRPGSTPEVNSVPDAPYHFAWDWSADFGLAWPSVVSDITPACCARHVRQWFPTWLHWRGRSPMIPRGLGMLAWLDHAPAALAERAELAVTGRALSYLLPLTGAALDDQRAWEDGLTELLRPDDWIGEPPPVLTTIDAGAGVSMRRRESDLGSGDDPGSAEFAAALSVVISCVDVELVEDVWDA